MNTHNQLLEITTSGFMDFIDITEELERIVDEQKINNGIITVFSKHTTAAIRINEHEKGICHDFKQICQKLLPENDYYQHNDLTIRTENLVCQSAASDCLNGHSHCLHLLMGATSESIPIIEGKMVLGLWQRVFLIELDSARPRQIVVHLLGE